MGVGVIININIGDRLDGLYLFIKALRFVLKSRSSSSRVDDMYPARCSMESTEGDEGRAEMEMSSSRAFSIV